MRGGWVYILTNKPRGVLYVGVTADISRRLWQHRNGLGSAFVRKYGLNRLVRVEPFPTIEEAIATIRRGSIGNPIPDQVRDDVSQLKSEMMFSGSSPR